jgi:glyoxylase-like metal-dependent hydrolase (beta-lactamase superfamily II)
MQIGRYKIHSIETGRFALDGGAMFGVVPRSLWEKPHPPDERNRITMAARALLLVGEGRRILIDTGNGSKFSEKFRSIYRIEGGDSELRSSLARHNVQPDEITDVILTHLHFDHAGGSTVRAGENVVPAFPNARYYVQRAQYEAAMKPTERDRASFFIEDYQILKAEGLLELTEGEREILPGIEVKVFDGHTTALQAPFITDGRTSLLFCADLIPLAAHVALPWIMAYDLRPLVTLEEKRRTLKAAAEEGWILYFEHDPVQVSARVKRGEKGFVLEDVQRTGEY